MTGTSKTGWCLTDGHHDRCPVTWWAWDQRKRCSCECHGEAE